MSGDALESALEDLALGRAEDRSKRLERREDDTGAEVKTSTASTSTRAPSARAIELLMRRRVGGPQDWC